MSSYYYPGQKEKRNYQERVSIIQNLVISVHDVEESTAEFAAMNQLVNLRSHKSTALAVSPLNQAACFLDVTRF